MNESTHRFKSGEFGGQRFPGIAGMVRYARKTTFFNEVRFLITHVLYSFGGKYN